jgi:hypothetical protein
MVRNRAFARLDWITLIGFAGLLTATLWKILFLGGLTMPAILSGLLFLGTMFGLLAVRARWISALAAAVALFALVGAIQSQVVREMLADSTNLGDFASTVLLLVAGAIGAIGGIGATVQRLRAS